jgi:hypothetical protein
MSSELELSGQKPEEEKDGTPVVDTPYDYRPDLSELGINETERGVCEDTFENRAMLRKALMNWDPVYDLNGAPTGLIAARTKEATKERRLLSLAEKRPLLMDSKDNNSDYATGLDLLVDDELVKIVPPWVVGAAKVWQAEQMNGRPEGSKKQPAALPHRCTQIKSDGIRCLLWASGRIKDGGLCRIHLRTVRKPGADVERARLKLAQSAPFAVDVLEDLMENAESEPVKLKAASEILDRAGIKGGYEFDVNVEVTDGRTAASVISERLERLAAGARTMIQIINPDILEAEAVVGEDGQTVHVVRESGKNPETDEPEETGETASDE